MEIKEYKTILIDPPWPEHGGGKCKRGADRHYQLLSVEDIPKVIQYECPLYRPADDAHLYLWTTDNYLPQALMTMSLIGFRYIRTLPWVKLTDEAFREFSAEDLVLIKQSKIAPYEIFEAMTKMGIGQYFRGCSELLLFGVRGKGMEVCTDRKDLNNIIIGPREKHSKKPDSSYDKIEDRSKGPYLEIFARSKRSGWDSWGNEL
jgi:N6-adenosine-specific RNA methylase IME4